MVQTLFRRVRLAPLLMSATTTRDNSSCVYLFLFLTNTCKGVSPYYNNQTSKGKRVEYCSVHITVHNYALCTPNSALIHILFSLLYYTNYTHTSHTRNPRIELLSKMKFYKYIFISVVCIFVPWNKYHVHIYYWYMI